MTNITNSITNKTTKPKFSIMIQSEGYQRLIKDTLGDKKRVARFIASISSAVSVNPALQNCDAGSVLTSALVGESLSLSPSPALGQFYIIPYGGVAQFQIGWKGYQQLALRTNQYKKLIVTSVKEGELRSYNPFTEEFELVPILNINDREKAKTVGYYAKLELISGFTKDMYWSKEKMIAHATRFSKAFTSKMTSSPWNNEEGFEQMAYKTMLRQLISKHGIMSDEMQEAYIYDMGVIKEDKSVEYIDNDNSDLKDKESVNEDE